MQELEFDRKGFGVCDRNFEGIGMKYDWLDCGTIGPGEINWWQRQKTSQHDIRSINVLLSISCVFNLCFYDVKYGFTEV